ncbi:hypothetical protein AAVH_14139 [Aphelenchoides avenae]|nr:hypothetical protein AAVH_14139 [Aphelenchus avenae]
MSKLFLTVIAFSTMSICFPPGRQGAYPGDDTKRDELYKAIEALQEPITVEKVKEVLKEHAPQLFQRIEAAEAAYAKVRDSIVNPNVKDFVAQVKPSTSRSASPEVHVVGLLINEQANEVEGLHKLYDALKDEAKKLVGFELNVAARAVEFAHRDPLP